jgi:hypothetical protein
VAKDDHGCPSIINRRVPPKVPPRTALLRFFSKKFCIRDEGENMRNATSRKELAQLYLGIMFEPYLPGDMVLG